MLRLLGVTMYVHNILFPSVENIDALANKVHRIRMESRCIHLVVLQMVPNSFQTIVRRQRIKTSILLILEPPDKYSTPQTGM